jgi:tetratricopeptide (TPR) repeat protein
MERLQELLSAPATGAAVNVPHHRSLTAALDWSYELLDTDEKALFARVSVFSGSFTSEGVEEVCGGFPTQRSLDDLVTSLVHKSLVVAERSPVEPRFRLLLVVKAFAESKLSPDDATILEERYVDRYRNLASLAREGLKGSETGYWLDLIAAEYDDFSNAMDRAGGPDRLEILAGLRRFWLLRGHWSEGLTRMRAAVEELAPSPVEPWIQTVIGVGALAQAKGDYKLAEKMYRQGLEAAAEAGLIEQEGYAENAIAMIALQQGSQDAARSHFEASLRLLKESGAHWATAGVLNNLGALAQSEGDLASARDLYQEALDTAKRLGDLSSAAICLNNLAEIAQGRDDLAEANNLLTESLQIARGLEDRHAIAVALNNLGITESAGGDTEGAEEHFREGIKVAAEIADEQAVRTGLEGLAATATAMGDQERASTLRGAASRLASPVVSGDQPVIDLGLDEDAFARGAGMGLDEAVTFALQGPGSRLPRR